MDTQQTQQQDAQQADSKAAGEAQAKKYLSIGYDHSKLHAEKIGPLIQQVHALCAEHKIPLLCVTAISNEPNAAGGKVQFALAAAMHGYERTPREFIEAVDIFERKREDAPGLDFLAALLGIKLGKPKAEQAGEQPRETTEAQPG